MHPTQQVVGSNPTGSFFLPKRKVPLKKMVNTKCDHQNTVYLAQAKLQLQREPHLLPTLAIKRKPEDITLYQYTDFELQDYVAHPHIKAAVAV
mgnify:CR=1 FL=1